MKKISAFLFGRRNILVPRAHDPSGLWQGSRALAGPNFLSMRRVFVSNSQPIRFARFDNKSVNRGLPVLDQTRALDPCHRPEGSWALGTRMSKENMVMTLVRKRSAVAQGLRKFLRKPGCQFDT